MQARLICLGLVFAALALVEAGPNPYAMPMANPLATPMAGPYPVPAPSCCGSGTFGCGQLGLCQCCGDTYCENGACSPIVKYGDGFYGAPRIQGGYGRTFGYGR